MAGWMVLVREGKYSVVQRQKKYRATAQSDFIVSGQSLCGPTIGVKPINA
jgi:hypothetical protein